MCGTFKLFCFVPWKKHFFMILVLCKCLFLLTTGSSPVTFVAFWAVFSVSFLQLFVKVLPLLPATLGKVQCLNYGLTPYSNKLMWLTVPGRGMGKGLYQFYTVGSRENLIPFHLSLSRCHSPPQVVITMQALTASSRLLKEEGKKKKRENAWRWMHVEKGENDISLAHRRGLMLLC